MRAWDILRQGSTLSAGTAWEHLTHQGGSGPVVVMSMEGNLAAVPMAASIPSSVCSASVERAELRANTEALPFAGSLVDVVLAAEVSDFSLSASILEEVL